MIAASAGLTPDIEGELTYVNRFAGASAEVPDRATTRTLTTPTGRAGDTTVMVLAEITFMDVPAVGPNMTREAPVNPDPVNVTTIPPRGAPELGRTAVTVGAPTRGSCAHAPPRPVTRNAVVARAMIARRENPPRRLAIRCTVVGASVSN